MRWITTSAARDCVLSAAPVSLRATAHPFLAGREDPRTWANLVTLVRAVAGLAVFAVAAYTRSPAWNFAGLAVYWALDAVDGWLARGLKQETSLGAQLDILTDRLLVTFFYLNYVALHPKAVVAVTLLLFQFCLVDHYLSNQFVRWKLLSPNYFYEVDRHIWLLNWSLPAKIINSVFGTALLLLTGSIWLASSVAIVLCAVKVYSGVRMHALPCPEASG